MISFDLFFFFSPLHNKKIITSIGILFEKLCTKKKQRVILIYDPAVAYLIIFVQWKIDEKVKRNCRVRYIYIKKTCSRRVIRITQVILKYQEVLLEWYAQSYLLSRFPNTEQVMAYNLIVGIGHFQTFSRTDTRFSLSFLQSQQ